MEAQGVPLSIDPHREKTCPRGFRPGPTQIRQMAGGLKFRFWDEEELYYLFSKKQKPLISCTVTAQFSHDAAHLIGRFWLVEEEYFMFIFASFESSISTR